MKVLISAFSKTMRNGEMNPKNYPTKLFQEFIDIITKNGHEVTQLCYKDEKLLNNVSHLMNIPLKEVANVVKSFDIFISVDNFLPHLVHAEKVGVPGIVIFSLSDPLIYGYRENINLIKSRAFLRTKQFDVWESEKYNPVAFIEVKTLLNSFNKLVETLLLKEENAATKH